MTLLPRSGAILLAAALLAAGHLPADATMPPRDGPLPSEVADALAAGALRLPAPPAELGTSAAQPVWNIPVILVGFADAPLVHGAATFDRALFDSTGATATGSVYDYYTWVSGGRIRVRGRVVATVQLPETRAYYAFGSWGLNRIATPNNSYGMVRDALIRVHAQVPWAPFDQNGDGYVDMLWVVHAGIGGEASPDRNDLWSITSAMSGYWNNAGPFETGQLVPGSSSQRIRLDRFTILPEMSALRPGQPSEIGVYCHEFGHALGLPDLYDTSSLGGAANVGPGNWSLMATGGWGGDNATPEYPTHLGAWPLLFLGWRTTVNPTQDTTLVLGPIADGAPVLRLWNEGRPHHEHFLVEHRRRAGFDRHLPAEGLVLYQIDESIIGQRIQSNNVNIGPLPGLRMIEADGAGDLAAGRNRADASDPFPGALDRSFVHDDSPPPSTASLLGHPTHVALLGIAHEGGAMRFTAQVRAPGWRPSADAAVGAYAPVVVASPATQLAMDGTGDVAAVSSEIVGGAPQIVLRTRRGEAWEGALVVSGSPVAAYEPSIAAFPNGDLAIVWADARTSEQSLWYRSRVAGVWMPEVRLADPPGHVRTPAIAADALGNVFVAWIQDDGPFGPVLAMRFPYLSPFGRPVALTSGLSAPLAPAIAARGDGGAVVAWADRAVTPQALRFAHVHPDSGAPVVHAVRPPSAGRTQGHASLIVDPTGTLHLVWPESAPGFHQIHYQRRSAGAWPNLPDTTLESASAPVQSLALARSPDGALHLAHEALEGGVPVVRYRRWRASRGWDGAPTSLSGAGEGSIARPAVAARTDADVTVLFTAYPQAGARLIERRRAGDVPPALAVAPAAPVASPSLLLARPNPVRAGAPLVVELRAGLGPPPAHLDVHDVAGRRVARVPFAPAGAGWAARLDGAATATWRPGIYLVRAGERAARPVVVLR